MKRLALFSVVFLIFISACQEPDGFSIYCIGDSTMANKSAEAYPETGWCMVLGDYFNQTVSVKTMQKTDEAQEVLSTKGCGRRYWIVYSKATIFLFSLDTTTKKITIQHAIQLHLALIAQTLKYL